jgi:surface antigen
MRYGISGRVSLLASVLIIAASAPVFAAPAHQTVVASTSATAVHAASSHAVSRRAGHGSLAARGIGGGLQCVTFARNETGIELSGNARDWWYNAEGVYDRGSAPQAGAILNFRSNGRMRLGHVSVVSQVVSSREILVDHANWSSRGGISRAVSVVDVSENNDWTAVRVRLGSTGEYGAIYPTYGFIYTSPAGNRPEIVTASAEPVPDLNTPPADLRNTFSGYGGHYSYTRSYMRAPLHGHSVQVAMAPAGKHPAKAVHLASTQPSSSKKPAQH